MPLKRHKKHKKHIKGKKDIPNQSIPIVASNVTLEATNEDIEDDEELCVAEVSTSKDTTLNLSSTSHETSAAEKLKSQSNSPLKGSVVITATTNKPGKKKRARRGSGTSSEEERWLDAIESGKLEQVDDELKKIKDPKLMTARQRALYERTADKEQNSLATETLMALPTGYKEKVLTAEAIQKAQLKSQKRKQMADEKREKDKKRTMDRLLKKQISKNTKVNKNRPVKALVPMISYRDSIDNGASLTFPDTALFPIQQQTKIEPPKIIFCRICNVNGKRYNCSKTNIPLCSFKCYQINVDSLKEIIC